MNTQALIIVDYQNDFVEGGALAVNGGKALAPFIQSRMNEYAAKSGLIIATRDWHPSKTVHFIPQGTWPIHCVADTKGSEYVAGIETSMIQSHIFKGYKNSDDGYSGFEGVSALNGSKESGFEPAPGAKTLEEILREANIRTVEVLGLATDFCVFATARDAQKLGFGVVVPQKGIAAVNVPGLPSGDDKLAELIALGVKVV